MEEQWEQALRYLERDSLLHMDMLEPIRRGTARLAYAGRDGVLLWEEGGGVPMLSAVDGSSAAKLTALAADLPGEDLVVHHPYALAPARALLGLTEWNECVQFSYTGPMPPLPEHDCLLAPLTAADAPTVEEHYHLIPAEAVRAAIEQGRMWGAWDRDGALMGFIGVHTEGAMGMLEVLPAYRRRGLAVLLETFLIRHLMEQGRVPFCQVFLDNAPSLALQEKLGLTPAEGHVYWVFAP